MLIILYVALILLITAFGIVIGLGSLQQVHQIITLHKTKNAKWTKKIIS